MRQHSGVGFFAYLTGAIGPLPLRPARPGRWPPPRCRGEDLLCHTRLRPLCPTAGTRILCPHRGSARTDRDSASLTRGRCAAAPPRLRGAAPALSARRSAAARVPAALAKPPILHSRMRRLPHPDPDPESESHGHPVRVRVGDAGVLDPNWAPSRRLSDATDSPGGPAAGHSLRLRVRQGPRRLPQDPMSARTMQSVQSRTARRRASHSDAAQALGTAGGTG